MYAGVAVGTEAEMQRCRDAERRPAPAGPFASSLAHTEQLSTYIRVLATHELTASSSSSSSLLFCLPVCWAIATLYTLHAPFLTTTTTTLHGVPTTILPIHRFHPFPRMLPMLAGLASLPPSPAESSCTRRPLALLAWSVRSARCEVFWSTPRVSTSSGLASPRLASPTTVRFRPACPFKARSHLVAAVLVQGVTNYYIGIHGRYLFGV